MEDSNKTVLPTTGNNENESENQRNTQQKPKNFMSPTISAASKMTTPKKKILVESDHHKLGNSASTPRKSLPKIPSSPSLRTMVVNSDDDNVDDVNFDPELSAGPYDPLTNYLSPRPRFLRYRPDRRRKVFINGPSLSVSVDSLEISSSESTLVQGIVESENSRKEGVEEEDEEGDEEDGVEEGNGGLMWGFLKCLLVFSALLFFTVYICSMNNPAELRQENVRGGKIRYSHRVGNSSSRIFSLRSLESDRWDLTRIEEFVVENEGRSSEVDQMMGNDSMGVEFGNHGDGNLSSRIVSLRILGFDRWGFKGGKELNISLPEITEGFVNKERTGDQMLGTDSMALGTEMDKDYFEDGADEKEVANVTEVLSQGGGMEKSVSDSPSEHGQVEIEASVVASESKEVTANETVVDSGEKMDDSEQKVSDQSSVNEVEIDDDDKRSEEVDRVDYDKMADFEDEMDDSTAISEDRAETVADYDYKKDDSKAKSEYDKDDYDYKRDDPKSEYEDLAFVDDIASEDIYSGIDLNKHAAGYNLTVNSELKSNDEQPENVAVNSAEDFAEGMLEENMLDIERRRTRLTTMDLIWLVISPLVTIGIIASLVLKFCCKCKKASAKTRSSNVKRHSQIGTVKHSGQELLPMVARTAEQVQKADDSQLKLPSATHSTEEKLENAPSRSISEMRHSHILRVENTGQGLPPMLAKTAEQQVQKADDSQLKVPYVMHSMEETLENASSRLIPKVRQLGEFEVGSEFATRSLLQSCAAKREMKERDESLYSAPDGTRTPRIRTSLSGRAHTAVQPFNSEVSTAESQSYGSYIDQEGTSKKEDGKEVQVATYVRRSVRIATKTVTSPKS